jgi:DNA-binding IclR family transcriptional regulator
VSRDVMSYLEKVAVVLDCFPGGSDLSLAEVCERSGLPRSTSHRLLVELVGLGWLKRVENRFELGMALFELGERVDLKHRLRSAALPFMQDLYAVTGQTVHLAVRDGADAVYVEKIHGHSALMLPSQIGGRLPLNCTAVGKALLAVEPPQVQQKILEGPLRRYTSNSITDPKILARQLDDARRNGLAVEREESALGGSCLASVVLVEGKPVAALSVSVPSERFTPELLAPAVRTAAMALGRVLSGAPRGTRSMGK